MNLFQKIIKFLEPIDNEAMLLNVTFLSMMCGFIGAYWNQSIKGPQSNFLLTLLQPDLVVLILVGGIYFIIATYLFFKKEKTKDDIKLATKSSSYVDSIVFFVSCLGIILVYKAYIGLVLLIIFKLRFVYTNRKKNLKKDVYYEPNKHQKVIPFVVNIILMPFFFVFEVHWFLIYIVLSVLTQILMRIFDSD